MTDVRSTVVCSSAKERSPRRERALILVMAVLMMSATVARTGTTGASAVTGSCAPKDARSDRLIAELKAFVGKTDMGGTVEKTTMGLASVTPSQVVLVSDKAICTKAAAAFDAKQLEKRSSYTLYVVTLGSSYGVEDTKMMQAGFETADIYDSQWKYIGIRQIHE
ncbi:MAG TPA: hypothetical protein VGI12_00045 [Vicinamibacterales bacterium]|jgi:hypothetical protein